MAQVPPVVYSSPQGWIGGAFVITSALLRASSNSPQTAGWFSYEIPRHRTLPASTIERVGCLGARAARERSEEGGRAAKSACL